jgi:MOSC domain-containing protein YiiM
MAPVLAVCVSEKKGEKKTPVKEIIIRENFGVVGDAHADFATHRQQVGDYVMPREGAFTKVIQGGRVRPGDAIKIAGKNG